jgi:hypothetical protein
MWYTDPDRYTDEHSDGNPDRNTDRNGNADGYTDGIADADHIPQQHSDLYNARNRSRSLSVDYHSQRWTGPDR